MFTLRDFVIESNRIEGIVAGEERLLTEIQAHRDFVHLDQVRVDDLVNLVGVLQPDAKLRDRKGLDVRVGAHVAPRGCSDMGNKVWEILNMSIPYKQHVAYETLHPFTDGNGRSGRALWLWAMRGGAPLGFLHTFYYQTLQHSRDG